MAGLAGRRHLDGVDAELVSQVLQLGQLLLGGGERHLGEDEELGGLKIFHYRAGSRERLESVY